jgi:CBS domain-containing protein
MTNLPRAGASPVRLFTAAPITSVSRDATIYEAADALAAADVGALVVEAGDEPVGIVTERDLVRVVAERRDPDATLVGDVAQTALVQCDVAATVAQVAELMMDHYIRHVLVERHGRLVGIVSARDLLGAYVSDDVDLDAALY